MLPKFSVRKPFTVVVAVIIVLVMGGISFTRMTTDLLPSMELPYVVIMTTYVGASPEEVETVVTKPIEQAVATAANVQNVSSISRENSSIVILEFGQTTNMDSAVLDLSSKLDLVKAYWDSSVGTPMMMRLNPNMMPVMLSAVDVDGMDLADVSRMVEDTVTPALEKIEGVASVTTQGLLEESLQVSISQEKLDALNDRVLRAIDANLADAKEQLDEAHTQLTDAKKQLNAQAGTQTQALQDKLDQLTAGRGQLAAGVAQAQSAYDAAAQGLAQLESAAAQLEGQLSQMNIQITALEVLGSAITPEQSASLTTLRGQYAAAQQQLAGVKTQRDQAAAAVQQLKGTLDGLNTQLAAADEGVGQLTAAQSTMQTKLAQARSQINAGLDTLAEKQEEFEDARDAAYQKASLDGVITAKMISGILTAQNFSMPAGYISTGGDDMLVKVGDKIAGADELGSLLLMSLGLDGVDEVRLSDVADVVLIDNADDQYAKVNGNPGVILMMQKQSTASTAVVCQRLNAAAQELMDKNEGLHISALMDQGMYIDMVIQSVIQNLLLGGALAVLILLLFLRDVRPTAIIAVSIPFSLVFAVALMYFTGVTLNIISLAGLALGVGMLVDNSIVVIENIYRMRAQGLSAREASVEGAKQVAAAITSSTLTTVCVFLPIVFVEGLSRQLFADMGLTIAYSLLASLIVALTLVPVMASGMLRREAGKPHKALVAVQNAYARALAWTLSHKVWVLLLAVLLLAGSAVGAVRMGTAFIPEMDGTQLSITMNMPKGGQYTTQDTRTMADQVADRILTIDDVETLGVIGGGSGLSILGGTGGGSSMSFYAILKEDHAASAKEIGRQIEQLTEDLACELSVKTSNIDLSILGGSGIEVIVRGDDLDQLMSVSQEVAALLRETEGVAEVNDGQEETSAELRVRVDKEKAMKYGLTVAQVFSQLSTDLKSTQDATTLRISNKDYPVIVVESEADRITARDLTDVRISGTQMNEGKSETVDVALSDIAAIETAQGYTSINRERQQRYVTVSGTVDADHNIGLVSRDFEKKLASYQAPEGCTLELSGENETINNSLRDLLTMIGLAVVLIYLIMVAQFQSLKSPFIVMFTIPLAFTGGLLELILCGMELSMISMLGFLVLAGAVVNNGIVFVDYANQLIREGAGMRDALVEAGKTRLRPILMTALTTILGLSTMALGIGAGADMLQPMAVTTIGGLAYATVLTLFVVPCLYELMNRRKKKAAQPEVEG
ncbi:MAG: efflux RND transporter permease subunit [Eubacteriales bacterium]|nr:efflux RND transporter permease subunit [Eubacteriales bacterium]